MAQEKSNYAGFGIRFVAYLVDVIILMVIVFVIGFVFALAGMGNSPILTALMYLLGFGYLIYFTGSTGQTLGKKALGIKVVKVGTNKNPDYVGAFLREVVGKFISGLILFLGYFWVIWDDKKQGWHDKIAGTVVIKVNK